MAYLRDLRINLRGFTWTYVDLRYFGGLTWITWIGIYINLLDLRDLHGFPWSKNA